jgi:hypothetical protein
MALTQKHGGDSADARGLFAFMSCYTEKANARWPRTKHCRSIFAHSAQRLLRLYDDTVLVCGGRRRRWTFNLAQRWSMVLSAAETSTLPRCGPLTTSADSIQRSTARRCSLSRREVQPFRTLSTRCDSVMNGHCAFFSVLHRRE